MYRKTNDNIKLKPRRKTRIATNLRSISNLEYLILKAFVLMN